MSFKYSDKVKSKTSKLDSVYKKSSIEEIKNSSGAYVYKTEDLVLFERFLILGTTNNGYYQSKKDLTSLNTEAINRVLNNEPEICLDLLLRVSQEGLCIKNSSCVYALALACCNSSKKTRNLAYKLVSKVCRTGTDLFEFVDTVKSKRGLGRGIKKAIYSWYEEKDPESLIYLTTKYNSRGEWSHKRILKLIRPVEKDETKNCLYRYLVNGNDLNSITKNIQVDRFSNSVKLRTDNYEGYTNCPALLEALVKVKAYKEPDLIIPYINEYKLAREHLPTTCLNHKEIWNALLLNKMPLMAMVRNLSKMSAIELLSEGSAASDIVISTLKDETLISKSRLHPLFLYMAYKQYSEGKGDKGSLTWTPDRFILEALKESVLIAFKYIEPVNKKFFVGIDISGSMDSKISSMNLTSREAAGIITYSLLKAEPSVKIGLFSINFTYVNNVNKIKSLEDIQNIIKEQPFMGTNCGLQIEYAIKNKLDVDCFITITDNEVNQGSKPSVLLREYRKKMNKPDAKLIVLATIANEFSIADPKDPNMFDIAGFSADVPKVISWINSK